MKVILSNKAYFKPDEKTWDYCSKQTTYQIDNHNSKYPLMFKNSGSVSSSVKWIPVTRLDLLDNLKLEYTIIDKRISVPVEIPKPKFTLREEDQQVIFNECDGTCIINAAPGFGKTIQALALSYKFQEKTLVICTNTNIRAMWEREVEKWFGFKPGVIGSGKFNTEPPIVISNIQTVNKHATTLSKMFGMVIVDEVHHCVASTFTKFLEESYAKIKIGLSGTLKRKDGLHVMFKDYFGFKIFTPAVNNTIPPTIHKYQLNIELSGNQNIPWATRANYVYNHQEYRDAIVSLCILYYKLGHKVLFVSERTEVLLSLTEALKEKGIPVYTIIGSTDLEKRLEIQDLVTSGGPCVLAAAQSIFAEGISINSLSCLIAGSLINNESLIEQLAGRVMRISDNKLDPLFIDIMLKGGPGFNQAKGRSAVYRAKGWNVEIMNNEKASKLYKIAFG